MKENPLAFAISLARKVGALLLEHFRSIDLQTHLKEDGSVVTEADFTADRLIAETIQTSYPDDWLMSEELHPTFSNDVDPQRKMGWIIDPLDGTTNFHLGLHFWGVLLTHLVNGNPDTTVMYFPLIDELYWAQRGAGAFLNDRSIHVDPPDPQRPYSFFACCSRTFQQYSIHVPYKARILGCSAYTFCAVARGVAVIGFEATPKIWDIAGPWLLVREAGGVIETLDGSQPFPLEANGKASQRAFPTLAAATARLAAKARKWIAPKEL